MNEKRCVACGDVKPLKDFYKCSKIKDGRRSRCKICFGVKKKPDSKANFFKTTKRKILKTTDKELLENILNHVSSLSLTNETNEYDNLKELCYQQMGL
jgi:predicted RNA-binding protein YlxR (DUF448 family)